MTVMMSVLCVWWAQMYKTTHMELHSAPATERQWVNCGFSSCFITSWHSTSRKLVQLQGQGEKSPALCCA